MGIISDIVIALVIFEVIKFTSIVLFKATMKTIRDNINKPKVQ